MDEKITNSGMTRQNIVNNKYAVQETRKTATQHNEINQRPTTG